MKKLRYFPDTIFDADYAQTALARKLRRGVNLLDMYELEQEGYTIDEQLLEEAMTNNI